MRPRRASPSATALLLAVALAQSGCGRGHQDAAAPAEGAPPGSAAPAPARVPAEAVAPAPAAVEDVPPPEGVLRAYVWDCDGGLELRMKNLYRENAITLEMHEGPRRLPQVVAASGAKYSDGSLTFWTKGGTAILERAGSAPVNCRELRAASLLADARERGVRFRGTGNEPGWLVEVGPGSRLLYQGSDGGPPRVFASTTERGGDAMDVHIYVAEAGSGRIKATVTRQPCTDDMSGAAFDHRMDVEVDGQSHKGCATEIR